MITDFSQRSLWIQAKIGPLAWKVTESVLILPLPPSAPQNLFFKLSVTGQIAAWAAPIEKVKITTYTFFNFPALQVHKIIPTSGTVGDQT